jgi:hypothetical protein
LLYNHLAQTQVISHWLILMKTLVHQFVNLGQLVWPNYGVGDVLLVPGGHVGNGPDQRQVIYSWRCAPVGSLSQHWQGHGAVLCYFWVLVLVTNSKSLFKLRFVLSG